jgi:DNA-binding response OmpR family regulator
MQCVTRPANAPSVERSFVLDPACSPSASQPTLHRCMCRLPALEHSAATSLQGAQILVVENDAAIREAVTHALCLAGCVVDSAGDAASGLRDAASGKLALLVLGEALQLAGGKSLIEHLRGAGNSVPALLLMSTGAEDRLLGALASGADDALQKPFSASELLLRVSALLRMFTRRPQAQASRLLLDDLQLDPAERKSYRAGRDLCLTAREFSILALLMQRSGEIVCRSDLEATLWSANSVYRPATLDVYMSRLRKKVDGGAQRKLLHTVRGTGFMLDSIGGDFSTTAMSPTYPRAVLALDKPR